MKYKHTIKRMAKLLTVHNDRSVTFVDDIDLREFVAAATDRQYQDVKPFGSLPELVGAVLQGSAAQCAAGDQGGYWKTLVEHGELLLGPDSAMPCRPIGAVPPYKIRVEFAVPPERLADWLVATGFPALSYSKPAKAAEA